MTDQIDKHIEIHGRMIYLIEDILEAVNCLKGTPQQKKDCQRLIERLAGYRAKAEFLAMGEEWARYNMEENEWSKQDIDETLLDLFGISDTESQPILPAQVTTLSRINCDKPKQNRLG